MSAPTLPPVNVPTLTEVVDWSPAVHPCEPNDAGLAGDQLLDLSDTAPIPESPQAGDSGRAAASAAVGSIDEAALTQRILTRVQQQVDLMLEERLPPVMAAVLDRAVGELVAHARSDLAFNLRDVVSQAVLDEIASVRGPIDSTAPGGAR